MSFNKTFERKGGHFHRSYKTPNSINSKTKFKEMNAQNSQNKYVPAGLSDSEDDTGDLPFTNPKQNIEELGVPNLHIRVVPSVFESCTFDGKPFDKDLDEATSQWFDKLKALWRSCMQTYSNLCSLFIFLYLTYSEIKTYQIPLCCILWHKCNLIRIARSQH